MEPNTTLLILTAFPGYIAIASAFGYWRSAKMLEEMWVVDTYEANELAKMCSGGFAATVEVQGEISCDKPLVSPATESVCCWHKTVVKRVQKNSDGERHLITAMNVTRSALFKVTDKTGTVMVDPIGAEVEAEEYCATVHGQLPWFENVKRSDTGEYEVTESVFLSSGYAFVLGRAIGTSSGVIIRRPDEGYADPKARFFMISRKTEKELTKSKKKSNRNYLWVGLVSFFITLYMILIAFQIVSPPSMPSLPSWRSILLGCI